MPAQRYIREKRSRQLKECEQRITEHESRISQLTADTESTRNTIGVIDKEVNESNASMTNLRENIRVRKLAKEIDATQAEIDAMDMEEAAKARRQFDLKYNLEKQRETEMQSKVRRAGLLAFVILKFIAYRPQYAHIGGELSSLKGQVETLEHDLGEFGNISRRYKDQLIKVKVRCSELVDATQTDTFIGRCLTWRIMTLRNTLRHWTSRKHFFSFECQRSLDRISAIMKYHSLKMEEVNDTMKHLWNKTYQGTGS